MAFKVAPVLLLALVFFQVLHNGMLRTVSAPLSNYTLDNENVTTSKTTNRICVVIQKISNSLKSIDTSLDSIRNTVREAFNSVPEDPESSSENKPFTNAAALR